jgi:hypothetical protein
MKRRPLLILSFLLVAGVGLFVWNASRDALARTFLLADGSHLRFRALTAGTNYSGCCGNPFQRLAARIPGRLGEMLSGGDCIRKNPSLPQFSYVISRPNGRAKALFRYQLVDDQGHELPDVMLGSDPTLRLKLTIWRGPADEEEPTEFIVPNPFYQKEP